MPKYIFSYIVSLFFSIYGASPKSKSTILVVKLITTRIENINKK